MSTLTFIDRMAVEIAGDGEPVVMIHGLGGSTNTWTPIMSAYARYKTIRIDLPGSGRSDKVEGVLTCERFVKAIIRVLGECGVERAHVVAHSMGTIVAAHLGAYEPKMVKSLVLLGPLLCPPDPARSALRARGQKARAEGVAGMQAIADALVQASTSAESKRARHAAIAFVRESLMAQNPEGYGRSCEALADMQSANTDAITAPALLITGDEDVVAPPSAVRAMGNKISGAKVEVIRGCGHWTPLESPDECMKLIAHFYASLERNARTSATSFAGGFR
jgi:3-oxoadipate enol-lactonase